jgi:hypothetical protein
MGQTDLWHFLPPAVAGGPSLLWRLVALLTGRPSSSAPTGPAPAAFIVNKYTPLFPPAEVGGKVGSAGSPGGRGRLTPARAPPRRRTT